MKNTLIRFWVLGFGFWGRVIVAVFLFPMFVHADRAELWIRNLTNENPLIQKNAVYYLGRMKEEKATPHLVKLLGEDISLDLEITIVGALGRIGDLTVLPLLRKRYVVLDPKDSVRKKAYFQAIANLEKLYEFQKDKP